MSGTACDKSRLRLYTNRITMDFQCLRYSVWRLFITRRTSVRLIRCTKNIYVGVCHTNLCISSRRCCMVRIDAQFRKSSPGTWLSVHCSGSTYISFIQIYRSKGTQQSTWILGASAAAGGSAGVFLGGAITEWLSWHWIFLINIPVGLIVLMRSRSLLFTGDTRKGKVDMAGAILATAALILMVYAIVSSESEGWGSVHTIGLLVLSLALLFAFMYFKTKSEPLMPLSILKYPIFQLVISLWLYWRQHGYHSGFPQSVFTANLTLLRL